MLNKPDMNTNLEIDPDLLKQAKQVGRFAGGYDGRAKHLPIKLQKRKR